MKLEKLSATEFRSKCHSLVNEVATGKKELIVTKRGEAVVKVISYREKPESLFGIAKDDIVIKGDIIDPIENVDWGTD